MAVISVRPDKFFEEIQQLQTQRLASVEQKKGGQKDLPLTLYTYSTETVL